MGACSKLKQVRHTTVRLKFGKGVCMTTEVIFGQWGVFYMRCVHCRHPFWRIAWTSCAVSAAQEWCQS